jgi:ribonuclease HI
MPVREISEQMAQVFFSDLQANNYADYLEIFTDGSKFTQPETSAAAAGVVRNPDTTHITKFRLPTLTSILGCELFAIVKALQFLLCNPQSCPGAVIYSDSMSSLLLIQSLQPDSYVLCVFEIHRLIHAISQLFPMKIQFITGHKNIEGNELADLAAKPGHSLSNITLEAGVYKEGYLSIKGAVLAVVIM